MTISSFTGQYRFLSNFYPCRVAIGGISYGSVEHAYQASKSMNRNERMMVSLTPTAALARRAGRSLPTPTWFNCSWDVFKLGVMRECVWYKFTYNPELAGLLLHTGDMVLEEGNEWGDTFWGICKGKGENWLGKILMDIRTQIADIES